MQKCCALAGHHEHQHQDENEYTTCCYVPPATMAMIVPSETCQGNPPTTLLAEEDNKTHCLHAFWLVVRQLIRNGARKVM
jgi:hypothetical protein